jgi:hypothetical protein
VGLDEPLPGLQWRVLRTPMRGERRDRNWQRLVIGERIKTRTGELTDWRLLAPPCSAGKDHMSRVRVECLGCNRVLERRLSNIIQGQSRRCRSCASRLISRQAKARDAS